MSQETFKTFDLTRLGSKVERNLLKALKISSTKDFNIIWNFCVQIRSLFGIHSKFCVNFLQNVDKIAQNMTKEDVGRILFFHRQTKFPLQ